MSEDQNMFEEDWVDIKFDPNSVTVVAQYPPPELAEPMNIFTRGPDDEAGPSCSTNSANQNQEVVNYEVVDVVMQLKVEVPSPPPSPAPPSSPESEPEIFMVNPDGSLTTDFRQVRPFDLTRHRQQILIKLEEEEYSDSSSVECIDVMDEDREKEVEVMDDDKEEEVQVPEEPEEPDLAEIDEIVADWRANRHKLPLPRPYERWRSDLKEPEQDSSDGPMVMVYSGMTLRPPVTGPPPAPWCFTCYRCKRKFYKKMEFTKHLFEVHRFQKKENVWNCADCQLNFDEKSKYEKHLKVFEHVPGGGGPIDDDPGKKRLKCPLCGRLCPFWDSFAFHWETDHPIEETSASRFEDEESSEMPSTSMSTN